MPQLWTVVGGVEKGGILVRSGEDFKSKAFDSRLSTGAKVEELELVGERLHYKLLEGTGPEDGWVSLTISGKVLVERSGDSAPDTGADAGEVDPAALRARLAERCKKEWARPVAPWQYVAMEQFQENYSKELEGMRYGMTFPHTPEMLTSSKYGAAWLTKAFHKAETMPKSNKVTKIKGTKPLTGGGACLKALIEVEYQNKDPELHTKLFMKYPFDYENKTQRSDRMNSSVMIQGMEIAEIDAYRLLEVALPFPMPQYYFGDISNVSTNFIELTELVKFGDKKKKLADFGPGEIEYAYDKFLDDVQFKPYDAVEYYRLMTASNAKMAAWYKTGKFGDPAALGAYFQDMSQGGAPGLSEAEFVRKINMGKEFINSVASVLFPKDLLTDKHVAEWTRVLNIVNTYKGEISWFAGGANDDYCAIMHGNMNPDNTWYWRDENKVLQIGALDWGGLGKVSFGPKIWWSFYAAEFEMFDQHLDELLQLFCDTYEQEGGPHIEKGQIWRDFMLAAVDQAVGILGAIPMIYRVIPKKQWDTVKDRKDQRLEDNFLTRMYVLGFVLIYKMIHKFDLGKCADEFVEFAVANGCERKPLAQV